MDLEQKQNEEKVFGLVELFIDIPDLINIIVKYAVTTPLEDFINEQRQLIDELDCGNDNPKPWERLMHAIDKNLEYELQSDFFEWLCEVHFLSHMIKYSKQYDEKNRCSPVPALRHIIFASATVDFLVSLLEKESMNFIEHLFYGQKNEQLYDDFMRNYSPSTERSSSTFYVYIIGFYERENSLKRIMLTEAPNIEVAKHNFLCDVCMKSELKNVCTNHFMKQILTGTRKLELCEETKVHTFIISHW